MVEIWINILGISFRSSLAIAVGSLALTFAPGAAQAVSVITVNVGNTNYDVTTFQGSYNDNSSKFETFANNGQMPWWGNEVLAVSFANAVGLSLGTPNFGLTPLFAFKFDDPNNLLAKVLNNGEYVAPVFESDHYAIATLTPAPSAVPGPLPLFGAAAAFGMSRRLRRRINLG